MDCGKTLRQLMEAQEITGRELSKKTGLTEPYVSALRSRESWSTDMVCRVSAGLGLKASEFVSIAEEDSE